MSIETIRRFANFASKLEVKDYVMPALFVGHGSPMNGIESNPFSNYWTDLAKEIPEPSAVLVVSAHWLSRGTRITAMDFPRTIHDFGGFPDELFRVQYPAPGSPEIAEYTARLVTKTNVEQDHDWGLDHGTWTIVRHMFPEANIPVLQLSIDYTKANSYHFELAAELQSLRRKGVLIIGSGNLVHNLRLVAWDRLSEPGFGFDWALQFNTTIKEAVLAGDYRKIVEYEKLGSEARLAVPTPEHFLPLLYTLGVKQKNENISFFNDVAVGGSLTMTSVKLG